MKNYQKYNFANIETKNFIAFCNVYNNRSGFVHECRLEPKSAIKLKNGSFFLLLLLCLFPIYVDNI